MTTILGIVAGVTIILDGLLNQWAIVKAVGALFKNAWAKVTGK